MVIKKQTREMRTPKQLREHYEFEKQLANKLRNASREERRILYSVVYDEFYRFMRQNPHLGFKIDPESKFVDVQTRMKLLKRYLTDKSIFLEIGPGDCSLSFEVAKYVKKVYAIDVCNEITKIIVPPKNFELIISDGSSIPVQKDSINIAYSNQLMEHLHPDDALDQLQNIYEALIPGSVYICTTPNRLIGPSDISKYFDKVSTGFHLKEYTVKELHILFCKAGFSKIYIYLGGKGYYIKFPLFLIESFEKFLNILPFSFRKKIINTSLSQALLGIRIVGEK
jgi:SAM-dependent methyltransferase